MKIKISDMKKKLLKIVCLLIIVLLHVTSTYAQDSSRTIAALKQPPLFSGTKGYRTWSIGLQGGAMMPSSVFGGKTAFSKSLQKIEYGGYIKYQASHVFGVQMDVLYGTLEGNNEKKWGGALPLSPYASFKTDVHWATSLSGVLTVGNISWTYFDMLIQPYISMGVGYVNFNPTTVNNAGLIENYKPVGSITDMYIPVGIGFKANLSNAVNLDLGYTAAYVDASDLEGYTKAPYFGSKFSYAHLGLEFVLGKSKKPQLARHNPAAQLYKQINDNHYSMRNLLAASEDKYYQRLSEISRLRDEQTKMKSDIDFDGVADYFDKCPGTGAGVKVDGAGCPLPLHQMDTVTKIYNTTTNNYIITEEDKRIANDAVRNLEFEFAKSTIRDRSLPYLNKLADLLVKKGISLKLGGHTDAIGSELANMKLSKDRAESLKSYLVSKGANGSRIEAVGYGETQPIATNKTEAGRQNNRRVEFTLY